ncbi:protein PAF1 homolog [Daucus carota subsp. sativus]|uniref:protein PAF1 homolog n=1 Tax=Daucus carota subsp. sativus TaxID=79200 RepID=UPI0030837E00
MKTKKQKVVTNPIRRPRTRSVITASNQMESTAQSSPLAENLPPPPPLLENLPPPPPLPENLPPPPPLPENFPPPPPLREELQPPLPSKKMPPVQTESQDEALERKKGRGPTLMNNVYTRRPDEKKIIKLNFELQAIADDDKVLSEFKNFLGTLSRQSVPLDCINWRRFPEKRKDELWSFVKTKYDIPEEGRTYTLRTIGSLWRLHKTRIKKDHYFKYDNDDDRLKNKPEVIPVEELKVLLNYWADEEVQKTEKKIPPEQLAPKGNIYEITHKRDPKRKYKTNPDAEDENEEPVKKTKPWTELAFGQIRVMAKLGDINPDFKNLDVEDLWAGDASEEDEEDNGEDDNNSEEDDIGEEGHEDEDDNN